MNLDFTLFDSIQEKAEESLRRRMHYDLRTTCEDTSQRMLNVLMKDTIIPIHRHNGTIVCRGAVREEFYDNDGKKISEVVLRAGGDCPGVQVPEGMYHTCVCLEDGSVIFEAKDGAYDPQGTEDYL